MAESVPPLQNEDRGFRPQRVRWDAGAAADEVRLARRRRGAFDDARLVG